MVDYTKSPYTGKKNNSGYMSLFGSVLGLLGSTANSIYNKTIADNEAKRQADTARQSLSQSQAIAANATADAQKARNRSASNYNARLAAAGLGGASADSGSNLVTENADTALRDIALSSANNQANYDLYTRQAKERQQERDTGFWIDIIGNGLGQASGGLANYGKTQRWW